MIEKCELMDGTVVYVEFLVFDEGAEIEIRSASNEEGDEVLDDLSAMEIAYLEATLLETV